MYLDCCVMQLHLQILYFQCLSRVKLCNALPLPQGLQTLELEYSKHSVVKTWVTKHDAAHADSNFLKNNPALT